MTKVLLILTLLQSANGSTENQLSRIQARIAVQAVTGTPIELAGVYVNPSKNVSDSFDLSATRTALYVFPDKTYIYAEQSSLIPLTIFDTGTWAIVSGNLELNSSPEVTWNPDLERRFLIIRRSPHLGEVLLIGAEMAVKRFEKLADNDPETALLTVSKKRRRTITPERARQLKEYLIRSAWHPDRLGQPRSRQF